GGATTSKVHTAVKIEENFTKGQTVHVLDASRSVPVVGKLLNDHKVGFVKEIQEDYQRLRDLHNKRRAKKEFLKIEDAHKNKFQIDFEKDKPVKPNLLGNKVFENYDLKEIAEYIDWTPFFRTWELAGKYPEILEDKIVGEECVKLFADATQMLHQIIDEKWLEARAVIGIWEANSVSDTIIEVNNGEANLQQLRQQSKKVAGVPSISLADFIAPKESGIQDYVGGFVVTTGLGIDEHIARFEADHDDYNSILLKALADRLAEAFAELMHKKVRLEYWGYATNENLDNEALIKENYKGIRPAPGYPACPDHTLKRELFKLLDATKLAGVELTESLAMFPTAAVSGFYFGNPQAKYFGLGKIAKDQIQEYAKQKNVSIESAEKWMSPNLSY
ncbi:MAG: methionine synthase, partial [Flavobacteriales bacterium]|nr:methionine synthase [Flavobacteriales bacterium]